MTRDEFVYYELTTLGEIGKIHFVKEYPETELLIEKLL